ARRLRRAALRGLAARPRLGVLAGEVAAAVKLELAEPRNEGDRVVVLARDRAWREVAVGSELLEDAVAVDGHDLQRRAAAELDLVAGRGRAAGLERALLLPLGDRLLPPAVLLGRRAEARISVPVVEHLADLEAVREERPE